MNILIPISIGELYDKISILKIKIEKMSNNQLENVKKEYDILISILEKNNLILDDLFTELYELNKKFWDYHDWQRERWKNHIDGLIDIELYNKSKEEHILNDERAKIKKKINLKHKSNIIEEKKFISFSI